MAPQHANTERIEVAQKAATTNPGKAEALYKDILSTGPGTGEAALREYETALMGLGELYRNAKKPEQLAELVRTSRSTLSSFAKAKTAKLGGYILLGTTDKPLLTVRNSPSTTRSLQWNPKYHPYTNIRHQIVHRMGGLRTPLIPSSKP